MKNQLSTKQLVRFPYCRIYRRFLNRIVENAAIRKQGQALLFRYRHHISKESLEKLKLDQPEVYDAYATVSESRTCSVKVKEETK